MSLEQFIHDVITEQLNPVKLEVINDSMLHAGHNAQARATGETHFTVLVVSAGFEGLSRVARHQKVYALLKEEMAREGGLHALVIQAYTPEEATAKAVL